MPEPVIEAQDLTKLYGDLLAVDRVSFRIERGEVVGFLGPNGAGKSTTLRVLAGVLPPSGGTARIAGHDVLKRASAVKKLIGYLPERPPLYPEMTVAGYLTFMARVKELSRKDAKAEVERVVEEIDLVRVTGRLIAGLSRGYQQRVAMAQALLGHPPVLLFDEPTLGLDPHQMQFVRALVRRLATDRTVLISTHFLYEVEEVCSRVLIIDRGHVLADAPLVELTGGQKTVRLTVALAIPVGALETGADPVAMRERALLELRNAEGVVAVLPEPHDGARFFVECTDAALAASDIARRLVRAEVAIAEISPLRRRLEDVYLELTDRAAAGGSRSSTTMKAVKVTASDAGSAGAV